MKIKIRNNQGMTTPEFILATMMLSAFTAVFVLVSQFIASFFQPLNEEAREDYIKAEKELTVAGWFKVQKLVHSDKINHDFFDSVELIRN